MFAHEARLLARQSSNQDTKSLSHEMIDVINSYITEQAKQGEYSIHISLSEDILERYPIRTIDKALSATVQYFVQMGYEVSINDKEKDEYTLLNISWEEK